VDSTTASKVLIVEDSKSFSAILKNLITQAHGYECDVVETLADTQKLLETKASDYFVATVDYHLPDGPNGEAIDVVVDNGIPAVVFTGKSNDSLKEDLWSKGITDYAHKSGSYNLEYVVWLVRRIHENYGIEVLVVDDSLVARRNMSRLLLTQRFVVHSAKSGEEALLRLKEFPNIRVCVLDCYMGGMDGFELSSRIRETYSRETMEIIGVSAQGGNNLSAEFIKSGANDFILKPFMPEEFLCRVNHAVERVGNHFEIERLNQLKNQFLGTAAHDIRGPIASIKTAADYLLDRSPTPERQDRLMNLIRNSSTDLIDLLETLLDISVIESGVPKLSKTDVNVAKIVVERLELYQAEAVSKGLTVNRNLPAEVLAVVDPLKMKQICDNLITNAIKYSEMNGSIEVSLVQSNDRFIFSIRDAGPGISEDEQEQLFQAFSVLSTKTTRGEKKTGLGLAITKSIVDAHGGKIYYKHSKGMQSTFFVELPLLDHTLK